MVWFQINEIGVFAGLTVPSVPLAKGQGQSRRRKVFRGSSCVFSSFSFFSFSFASASRRLTLLNDSAPVAPHPTPPTTARGFYKKTMSTHTHAPFRFIARSPSFSSSSPPPPLLLLVVHLSVTFPPAPTLASVRRQILPFIVPYFHIFSRKTFSSSAQNHKPASFFSVWFSFKQIL